jgi:hypothetical protein
LSCAHEGSLSGTKITKIFFESHFREPFFPDDSLKCTFIWIQSVKIDTKYSTEKI